jgi:uncharacterized protein YceK
MPTFLSIGGAMKGAWAFAVGAVCMMSGCGTVQNLTHTCVAYGGIEADVDKVEECLNSSRGETPGERAADYVFGYYVALIDLPLSFAGDTITIPLTYFNSRKPGTVETLYLPPPKVPPEAKASSADELPPLDNPRSSTPIVGIGPPTPLR